MARGGVVHFPYGAVVRLVGTAARYWHAIDGACAGNGVDLLSYPLTRFLNYIYFWIQEHTSPEEWEAVEEEIFAPLALSRRDPDNVSQNVVEQEMTLFANFTRQNDSLARGL